MAALREVGADASRQARTRCVACTSRKLAEQFPLDGDTNERILVTCSACLGQGSDGEDSDSGSDWEDGITGPRDWLQTGVRGPSDHDWQVLLRLRPQEASESTKRKRAGDSDEQDQKRPKQAGSPELPKQPEISTCRVCIEDKPVTDFPMRPIITLFHGIPTFESHHWEVPPACAEHLSADDSNPFGGICKICIAQSLKASIELKGAERVGCPHEGCNDVWHPIKFVSKYLSHSDFEAYSQQLFNTWARTDRRLKQCLQPRCRAEGLMETGTAGYPHLECYYCKTHQCANCEVEWHQGQTCQEYRFTHVADARSKEEIQTLRSLEKQGARRCPYCSLAIVKVDGCTHMWCLNCNQHFSWYSAEKVKSAPMRKIMTRAQKKAEEALAATPQLTFSNHEAECEIDGLERLRQERKKTTHSSA